MANCRLAEDSLGNSITISRVTNGWGMDLERVEYSNDPDVVHRIVKESSVSPNLKLQLKRALEFFYPNTEI